MLNILFPADHITFFLRHSFILFLHHFRLVVTCHSHMVRAFSADAHCGGSNHPQPRRLQIQEIQGTLRIEPPSPPFSLPSTLLNVLFWAYSDESVTVWSRSGRSTRKRRGASPIVRRCASTTSSSSLGMFPTLS